MTLLVTRRTLRRTHLLRPDAVLTNIFRYCLAVTARKHGVLVHAAVLMSTHEHLIVTDTRGVLPRFLQELHRLLALCVKVLRRWEGAVWDHEKTSVVELRTIEAIREKLAYVIANPVAAGLVHKHTQWPGVTLSTDALGRGRWIARRPDEYFSAENRDWPPSATLELVMPPQLAEDPDEFRAAVAAEVVAQEQEARANVQMQRWTVCGARKARSLSPYRRARSWEPVRGRNPTFAVGRGMLQAARAAVAELRAFRREYRLVLERWRAGCRDVLFPQGTWLMRLAHAAWVAPES